RQSMSKGVKVDELITLRLYIYHITLALAEQVSDLDDFVTAWANAHPGNADPGQFFKGFDVLLGVFGQIFEATGTRNIFVPAREVFINGIGVVEIGLGHRHGIVADPIDVVGNAHRDLIKSGQHVQFGHEVVGEPVDQRRVMGHDGVTPAGAARTTGVHTEFAVSGAQLITNFIEKFGGEWSGPHAGGICLDNANGAGKASWTNAGTNRSASGSWV